MPILNASMNRAGAGDVNDQVKRMASAGWEIVSDGPTGVQMRAPRKMKTLDQLCLIVAGGAAFYSFAAAGFFVAVALIDYYALTKRETKFISR